MGIDYDALKSLVASQNQNLSELDNLSDTERSILIQIVNEIHDKGSSSALGSLWYEDYNEIPVDIDTFIEDPTYLGNSLEGTVYPYWREKLRQIFAPGAKYFEVIFSMSIGCGKSTIADVALAYMLHKLMCMKSPQSYYGLTKSSIMTVNFFNISKVLAYAVSYGKFQSMVMNSPWFLERGEVVGRTNEQWVPNGNIRLMVGSQAEHALGQDVFCLAGDTLVETNEGTYPIQDLVNKSFKVKQSSESQLVFSNPCTAVKSGEVSELVEIELDDGTIVKCTPGHRWLLKSGVYKKASELSLEDELMFYEEVSHE